MKVTSFAAAALAGAALVAAQSNNSSDASICDKYSQALLNSTEGAAQKTLLTLLVNSAVIGNYSNATAANAPVKPSGILTTNGTVNGTGGINLLKYFDGSLLSTNRGGQAVSVNFLDGGGADPLKANMPANDTSSNQYILLTHLYEYFGYLLGCSSLGKSDAFPAYNGSTSMASVHKFMNLSPLENAYFIQEVAYSALSFGVEMSDVEMVGEALGQYFNNRCGGPIPIPSTAEPASQSICLDPSCPIAANGTCNADNTGTNGTAAAAANSSSSGGSSGGSSSGGSSSGGSSSGGSSSGGSSNDAKNVVASGFVGALFLGGALAAATLL